MDSRSVATCRRSEWFWIGAHTCTNHTVPYGTVLLGWRCPRHFVLGDDHAVPLGRNRFRAEALIKLALMPTKQVSALGFTWVCCLLARPVVGAKSGPSGTKNR